MGELRAGVAGAGVFGGYHASKYADHADARLTAVFDPDHARAQALADKHGATAAESFEALLDMVDVVTIASAAPSHGALGLAALEAGKHVLVEKPLATSVAEAEAMVARARSNAVVLQAGHQERFVAEAIGLFDAPERPLRIEARRLNVFNVRGSDVSVALDLMVHDIDMARRLGGRAALAEMKGGTRSARTAHADEAEVELAFEGGLTASLRASRLAETTDRAMKVTFPSGVVEVDFVNKTFANSTPFALNPDFRDAPKARDSLGAGVAAFIDAVLGRAPVLVTGEDGLEAVRIALALESEAAAS